MSAQQSVETMESLRNTSGTAVLTYNCVLEAKRRLNGYIKRTPVLTSRSLNCLAACSKDKKDLQLFFKCENVQRTGSFKARGSANAVLKALETEAANSAKGFVTCSSGNHGLGISRICKLSNVPCTVVVPRECPQYKRALIRENGAQLGSTEEQFSVLKSYKYTYIPLQEVCQTGEYLEKLTRSESIAKERGMTLISSSNHKDVIAGQGTAALEFMEQMTQLGDGPLDAILAPLNGGGLLAGTCIAVKEKWPKCKVIGIEPTGKHLSEQLRTGKRDSTLWYLDTKAEGIKGGPVGDITFPILYEHLEKETIIISDEEMYAGQRLAAERLKVVLEMSSGAAIAAALKVQKIFPDVEKVGVILCGGNVSIDKFMEQIRIPN